MDRRGADAERAEPGAAAPDHPRGKLRAVGIVESRRKSDAIDDFLRARKPPGAIVINANWRDKLLIWDKVLGLGTTDPLAGFAAITSNLVVSFYFAKRGFENVARIIKR